MDAYQRTTGERRESIQISRQDLSPADQLVMDVFARKYCSSQPTIDTTSTQIGRHMSEDDAAAIELLRASLANRP